MLLLQSHGNLQKEIVDAGYNVKDQIYVFRGHNHLSMAKSLGVFMSSFVDSLARENQIGLFVQEIEVNSSWQLFADHILIYQ